MFKLLANMYFLQKILANFIAYFIPPFAVHNIGKYFALKKAFYLTNLENLEGDYLEFGVFTGSSLNCALQCSRSSRLQGHKAIKNFFGFDSFEGFGDLKDTDQHPFYTKLNFETSYDSVNKRLIKSKAKDQTIKLVKGFFDDTLKNKPQSYGIQKAAIILLDSDTKSSAKCCLNFCKDIIQEGTILILDDFYSYKGNLNKGVAGAFSEWTREMANYEFRRICDYGMGGAVYIVCLKEEALPETKDYYSSLNPSKEVNSLII